MSKIQIPKQMLAISKKISVYALLKLRGCVSPTQPTFPDTHVRWQVFVRTHSGHILAESSQMGDAYTAALKY